MMATWENSPDTRLVAVETSVSTLSSLPACAVIPRDGWTAADSGLWSVEYVPGAGPVLAPFRSTFNVNPARDITDFDAHGWTGWSEAGAKLTGSSLDGCYESAGTFRLYSKDNTSGSWGQTTRDAPRRGKAYSHWSGRRFYFCVDTTVIPSGIGGVICWLDGLEATTNSLQVGLGGGGTTTSVRRIRPGTAVDTASGVDLGAEVAWFRLTFAANVVVVEASASATRPTSDAGWTYIVTVDNLFTGSGLGTTAFRPRLNIATAAINASSALTGFYVDFPGWDDSEMLGAQWGATKLETSGYVLSRTVSLPAGAVVSNATLRTALASAVVGGDRFETSGWTARAKRGGAPSGAYAAFASVAQEATTGANLYIDLKYTSSDGIKRGALRDMFIPITGA